MFAVTLAGLLSLMSAPQTQAVSLKLQPLTYRESLSSGETKTGFIDVSNPTEETLRLTTTVEGFRQVDDEGQLEFFASEQLEAAITLDSDEFRLEPKQAMRLVFAVDGSKLPEGDVFAALLVATEPDDEGQIGQSVRAGTLLFLENGSSGARQAEITSLEVPSIVTSGQINGRYGVRNTADAETASGFFPEVELQLRPLGSSQTVESTLVFAGNERRNQFSYDSNLVGVYQLSASYGESSQSRWVVLVPMWFLLIVGLLLLVGTVWLLKRLNRI